MSALLLGGLLKGAVGLAGMHKGNQMMNNIANNMPDKAALQDPFSKSQGLIDRMTNFGQYSGQAMDLASQEGNQGVENAMMMGMGGSQANAIRNRMKKTAMGKVYNQYNQGMSNMVGHQGRIDQTVSNQMHQNAQDSRTIGMNQGMMMQGIGSNIMGGKEGMSQFGNVLGSVGGTALKSLGGLFGLGK